MTYFLHIDVFDNDHVYLYRQVIQKINGRTSTCRIADYFVDDIQEFYGRDVLDKVYAGEQVYVTKPTGKEIKE